MLSKGTYAAVVVPVSTEFGELACQFGHSKEKGTPQVSVTLEVLRGPHAGQRISWMGFFTDSTEERTLKALRVCGFDGDDLDKFADQRPSNEVQIVVEHEEYKGVVRAKVAWINDPSFGGGMKMANALSGSELRKFGAQFKSKLKSLPAVKTVEAKREPPSAAPPGDEWSGNDSPDPPPTDPGFGGRATPPGSDDDIPF
jgi:hypothetical protein